MAPPNQTKANLQRVAVDLIARQGYDATTVEQIAAAAGVSHMTFFRHFRTKESVILDDPFDPAIGAAVAAQPADQPPLQRACRGLRAAIAGLEPAEQDDVRLRVRIGTGSPTLLAGMWANTVATQDVVASALMQEPGGVPELPARVAAAATIGALTSAVIDWGSSHDETPLSERLLAALDVLDPQELTR